VTAVDIPDQAMDVAWRTFSESLSQADSHLDYVEALADAITAAAPLIVATELRRLADELYEGPQRWPWSKAGLLRDRANELTPPGGAS
jgi:hypothetical protein